MLSDDFAYSLLVFLFMANAFEADFNLWAFMLVAVDALPASRSSISPCSRSSCNSEVSIYVYFLLVYFLAMVFFKTASFCNPALFDLLLRFLFFFFISKCGSGAFVGWLDLSLLALLISFFSLVTVLICAYVFFGFLKSSALSLPFLPLLRSPTFSIETFWSYPSKLCSSQILYLLLGITSIIYLLIGMTSISLMFGLIRLLLFYLVFISVPKMEDVLSLLTISQSSCYSAFFSSSSACCYLSNIEKFLNEVF